MKCVSMQYYMYVTLHKKQTYEHVSGKDKLYCTLNLKTISYFKARHENVVGRRMVKNYFNIQIVSIHFQLYAFSKYCIEFCNLMYYIGYTIYNPYTVSVYCLEFKNAAFQRGHIEIIL